MIRAKSFAARVFSFRPKTCRPGADEPSRRTREKTSGTQGIQTLPSPLAPSAIVFFSVLGSAFARLNLLLLLTIKKNTHKKIPPATQAIERGSFMNSYRPSFSHSLNLFWMSHSCAYFISSVSIWRIHHLVSPSTIFSP